MTPAAVALSPEGRAEALRRLADEEYDILVIGGGVVGAGSALDAATRGLKVGVVEARDWASGTSSRSSKLIHGGLRYLEMLDFRLVHEALIERGLMLQVLAPHLVKPLPVLYPLKHRIWERLYAGAGLLLYDLLARTTGNKAGLPFHRHLTRRQALRLAPGLKSSSLTGALQYYDATVDDARHTMTVIRTAATYGAVCANRTRVAGLLRDGDAVIGAQLVDRETGAEFSVRAKVVLNATGVWTDEIHELANTKGLFQVRMSKGVHITVPRDRIDLKTGLILRTEKSVLFVTPWGNHWLIGTTDTDWRLRKDHPSVSADNVAYLLERVNEVVKRPLTLADIEGVYAGLRPLLAAESAETTRLSREHFVGETVPNLFVIAGGKYTTYRVMAADAIDAAVKRLDANVPASSTAKIPLVGAHDYAAMAAQSAQLATEWGVPEPVVHHLLNRYGGLATQVAALIADDPSLGQFLPGSDAYLRAEIVYGVTHEGAVHLEDVLTRRTRIYIETFDRGTQAAPDAAALMGGILGWSAEEVAKEVTNYRARDAAEREAQSQPDDLTAEIARYQAPEINPSWPTAE